MQSVTVSGATDLVAVLPSSDIVELVDDRFHLPAGTAAVVVERGWLT